MTINFNSSSKIKKNNDHAHVFELRSFLLSATKMTQLQKENKTRTILIMYVKIIWNQVDREIWEQQRLALLFCLELPMWEKDRILSIRRR